MLSRLKFDGEEYEFIADESGTIKAVGDEAKKRRYEKNHKKEIENNELISANFREKMEVWDSIVILSDYQKNKGEKTAQEAELAEKARDYLMKKEKNVYYYNII